MNNQMIVLFDGVCNFCNYWVNLLLKRDKKNIFLFAALQSESGQDLLKKFNLSANNFDSFILIDGDSYQTKSDAVISIAKNLSGFTRLLVIGKFLPKVARDFVYDLIAKNRYKIFGKRDSCRIPTAEEKEKFLS